MDKDSKISMPQNIENKNMVENTSCIEWLPLHKKILAAAAIGLILLVIIVLVIVFATKGGK